MMGYVNLYNWIRCCSLVLMAMAACGCNTMAASSVSVLERGYQCDVSQVASVQLVDDIPSQQVDNTRIGDASQKSPKTVSGQNPFWIVRVNMGQQPSGGYGLRLISDRLEISSNTARVVLEWLQPESGSVQIQTLTYPCLYLKVAKGNYSRLDIVDQKGEVRHSLDLTDALNKSI